MVSAHERLNVQSARRLIHSEFHDLMLRCAAVGLGHDHWISHFLYQSGNRLYQWDNGYIDYIYIY